MYPVMLDLRGRRVLVVGAGPIAARKITALVSEGAIVHVIAPDIHPDVEAITGITIERRRYRTGDIRVGDADGYRLVIVSTDVAAVQQQVFDDGEALGVWVNAADDPERCSFILPAVHRDGPITVTVSTSGASPALAGYLRDRAAAAMPEDVAGLARRLAALRAEVKASGRSTESFSWRPIIDDLVAGREPRLPD